MVEIKKKIKKHIAPEIAVNILLYNLGLIYNIKLDDIIRGRTALPVYIRQVFYHFIRDIYGDSIRIAYLGEVTDNRAYITVTRNLASFADMLMRDAYLPQFDDNRSIKDDYKSTSLKLQQCLLEYMAKLEQEKIH